MILGGNSLVLILYTQEIDTQQNFYFNNLQNVASEVARTRRVYKLQLEIKLQNWSYSIPNLVIRGFLPKMIIFKGLFGARVSEPSSAQIIMLCDEAEKFRPLDLDGRELVLVVLGKGAASSLA